MNPISQNNQNLMTVYLHGMESGPQGTKGSFIKRRFGGSGPQMPARYEPTSDQRLRRPRCFEECLEIAQSYLLQTKASVLVGSSFGGAITVELLQRGFWRGPIVLLAPAAGRYDLNLKLPQGCHAIVIHDPEDELIPYSDAEKIARMNVNSAELWPSDGGHRLSTITENGLLERAVQLQLNRSSHHV